MLTALTAVGELGFFTQGQNTIIRAETGEQLGPESGFEITLVNLDGDLVASDFIF
jgi:hypothetical protein